MRRCFDTEYVLKRYNTRGEEYKKAMESATINSTDDQTCFDDQHDGWKKALELSKKGPGQVLSNMIKMLTGERPVSGCSCNDRIRLMNLWGYKRCFKERKLITAWLRYEADKRGYQVDKASIRSLFLSLLRSKSDE